MKEKEKSHMILYFSCGIWGKLYVLIIQFLLFILLFIFTFEIMKTPFSLRKKCNWGKSKPFVIEILYLLWISKSLFILKNKTFLLNILVHSHPEDSCVEYFLKDINGGNNASSNDVGNWESGAMAIYQYYQMFYSEKYTLNWSFPICIKLSFSYISVICLDIRPNTFNWQMQTRQRGWGWLSLSLPFT